MNKGDRVYLKVGGNWSRQVFVVAETNGDFFNIGHVGNGRWLPASKLRLASEVEAERKTRQAEQQAGKPLARIRTLMQDGEVRTPSEIAKALDLNWWGVRCMLGRIREIKRTAHEDTYQWHE